MSDIEQVDEMEVEEKIVYGQCVWCPDTDNCTTVEDYFAPGTYICVSSPSWAEGDYVQFTFKRVKRNACCISSNPPNTAIAENWEPWTPPSGNG